MTWTGKNFPERTPLGETPLVTTARAYHIGTPTLLRRTPPHALPDHAHDSHGGHAVPTVNTRPESISVSYCHDRKMSEVFENQFYNKNMRVHSGVVCMVNPGAPLAEIDKGVQSKNFKKSDYIQ